MNYIVHFFIFVTVLFLYIHIVDQYKKSEDLEIYEADYYDNTQFQEICHIRQPFLFDFRKITPSILEDIHIIKLAKKTSEDVNVYDIQDYWKSDKSVEAVSFPMETTRHLLESDASSRYFSESNFHYLADCGLEDSAATLDHLFRPPMTVHSIRDLTFGSEGAYTPLRYHTDNCHLIFVTAGKLRVKMTPWKNSKYLFPIQDYEKGEYKSPLDPWSPQEKYKIEMEKLKFLDFDVYPGYTLYVPAYWWFSLRYSSMDTTNDELCTTMTCVYSTIFNRIAHLPDIFHSIIQKQWVNETTIKDVSMKKIVVPVHPPSPPPPLEDKSATDLSSPAM